MQKLNNMLMTKANAHFDAFILKLESDLAKVRTDADHQQHKPSASDDFNKVSSENISAKLHAHKALILSAFALSDFIARIASMYPLQFALLVPHLAANPKHEGQDYEYYHNKLHSKLLMVTEETELHAVLRQFRHLNMLAIAWRDLLYQADVKHSLLAISNLADSLINAANDWLYEKACERYGNPSPISNSDPIFGLAGGRQELLVIGMGKLGGRELNFSSDIDLIFVYPESGETQHPRKPIEHQKFFTRLAQKLISALHQTTMDGQVYRVDMRLRPLGDSGPIVVSMPAFESYYLEQGREWERFAMQKARIINADSVIVDALQDIITPFVYRKYLDFTTIESLRNMKQLIASEVARRNLTNNIKLGKGGIREVEFFVQSLQMIHAGKVTECQTKSILSSFSMLVEHEFLGSEVANELQESYLFLRKVEHYLQAFDDKQTQQLPSNELDQERLAYLLASDVQSHAQTDAQPNAPVHTQAHTQQHNQSTSFAACVAIIDKHMQRINQHFMLLIESPDDEQHNGDAVNEAFQDLWRLNLEAQEMQDLFLPLLSSQGQSQGPSQEPSQVPSEKTSPTDDEAAELSKALSTQLLEFKTKCTKHVIGQRGQNTLDKLIPCMLQEVISYQHGSKPSALFERIFNILLTIVGRTAYLDLLFENPAVRQRLITLSATSEWLAQQIKAFPLLLDELLYPAYLQADTADIHTWRDEYENELRMQLLRVEPEDVEAQMDALRYFKLTQQLRIAAADISGTLPIRNVSDKLTVLAEVLLHQVIDIAWLQIAHRFGVPEGYTAQNKGLGVIAYGKMGGIEMGYGSDLDIVFVHDVSLSTLTNGPVKISCSEFFVKLVQRVMHIFTTKTYLNELYEIDLRLRPSGNSGLLISHIERFATYQQNDAWTWEHQALVRARYVLGHQALKESFELIRHQVLAKKRDANRLKQEVIDMREKMRKHLDKSNEDNADLKQTSGGITDLEFLTQYWVLLHTNEIASLSKWTDNLRILDSLAQAKIINETQNIEMQTAYLFIRNQLHRLSLGADRSEQERVELTQHMAKVKQIYRDALLN